MMSQHTKFEGHLMFTFVQRTGYSGLEAYERWEVFRLKRVS